MQYVRVFRGKFVALALVGVAIVAGATAVFAATPVGQRLVHTMTGSAHAMATPDVARHENNHQHATHHQASHGHTRNCPGLPDAQQLAMQFSLSADSQSDDIQAMCSLHQGTFTGTTPNHISVSSNRIFGYGEIDALLTYAQYLAGHEKVMAGGKLTSSDARSYLAAAVQSCSTTPLVTCLKTTIPGFQPGNENDGSQGGNGTGHGKPSSPPTPHH